MAKASPRTITRDEPVNRAPPREAAPEQRAPQRDPNAILTRDGRAVDLNRVRNPTDDRTNLAALGVFAPEGWVYEWRTRMVKNVVWTDAITDDEENGWTPVPAERHDGKLMPRGYKGPVERGGLMLMERDARLARISREAQRRNANEQLNISRSMTGLMQKVSPNSGDIFDQSDISAQRATGVKIERVPVQASDNKGYTYTLDE